LVQAKSITLTHKYWFCLYQTRRVRVMYLCVRVIDFACTKPGELGSCICV
jgi:hypothetical protein